MTKVYDSKMSGVSVKPAPITVADVRASFNANIRDYFALTWFGRPFANLITPFFYNRGWSANQVTGMRVVIAVIGVGLLAIPGFASAIIAALIFYAVFVLDCVDGNIARLRGQASFFGKFIDGLADFIFILAGPAATGVAIWWQYPQSPFLVLGALCTIVSVASQMVRSRLSFVREWMINQSGPIEDDKVESARTARRVQGVVAAIFVNGTFLAPLLLLIPVDGRIWYVSALLFVQLLPELVWIAATIFEGQKILDRGRRSIHSAENPVGPAEPEQTERKS
ncbi:MAG: CDP-alcohol phosphatidyltransferase family protein [Alphaproteobacteria bacterium]